MKKYTAVFVMILLCFLAACGRAAAPGEGEGTLSVYRPVKEDQRAGGSLMETEELVVRGLITQEMVASGAEALMAPPKDDDLDVSLPEGVVILKTELFENTVSVLMNDNYTWLTGLDKTLTDACVVLTLCSVPGVDFVSFKTEDGSVYGPVSSEDLIIRNTMISEDSVELRLYFFKAQSGLLGAEYRQIDLKKDVSPEQSVIDELIKGPESGQLISLLPQDTALLSVYTKDGLCTVSFSGEFLREGEFGYEDTRLAVYSIINSLTCLSGVDRVQIFIRGDEDQIINGVDISSPFERNSELIGSAVYD